MKAIRLVTSGRPLELREVDVPAPGPEDVLVRVMAAGICHSDAHYRAGVSPAGPLPLTLGHEVAGVVEQTGDAVTHHRKGDRVCLHYLVTCGECEHCRGGHEQFCASGAMIGKHRDGGYAEMIRVPARNAFDLPAGISFAEGAVMMCSSATSFHALRKARLEPGESVAVFGVGGLGMSAVQLARAMGASQVFAVDIQAQKLAVAEGFGAVPVPADRTDPVAEIRRLTQGRGVDVALELVGLPLTMRQSIGCLAALGRAAMAGISDRSFEFTPYVELIGREAEMIGVSDHLAGDIPLLMEYVERGALDLSGVVTRTVPLDATAINDALDRLDAFESDVRTVIAL
jgi:2-desacetyl-2-hydroxyethyl bacteriochlorophyllide A dehydrogenase